MSRLIRFPIADTATYCVECQHLDRTDNDHSPDHWVNFLCGAPETQLPIWVDPVTKKPGFAAVNDLGLPFFTEEGKRNCRTINQHASCPHFEEKQGFVRRLLKS